MDMRKYSQHTIIQLIIGAILILFIVGDGLIYLIYGQSAAITGLLCLAAGMGPVIIIGGIMALINWISKKYGGD